MTAFASQMWSSTMYRAPKHRDRKFLDPRSNGVFGNGQSNTFENGPTTTSEALQIDSISIGSDLDFASMIAGMQNSDTINLTNFANPTGHNFDGKH